MWEAKRRLWFLVTVVAAGALLMGSALPVVAENETLLAGGRAVDEDDERDDERVRQTEVCFTVHVPGSPRDHQVSGTLFHTRRVDAESTALLLLHGAEALRSFWDGGQPHVKGAPSTARALAEAGYGVFAIDRLGYGRSPYFGSGHALTLYSYVEMTHEIVTQIRAGTYRVTANCSDGTGDTPDHGFAHVVLSGLSSGAGIVELYATRYHDIAGIVPMAWSNQGVSREFGEYWFTTVSPQFTTSDYVRVFPDEEACVRWLFHLDGLRPRIVEQFCSPEYFNDPNVATPAGEQWPLPAVMQDIKGSVGLVGPTPVLLVFADRDSIFPAGEDGSEDVVTPEIQMWRDRCNCNVSVYMQRDAGHANNFHDTAREMVRAVIDWLRSHGL